KGFQGGGLWRLGLRRGRYVGMSREGGELDKRNGCRKTDEKTHVEAHPLTPLLSPKSHCDDVSLEETLRAELGQLPEGTFARMRRTPYVLEPCGLRKDRRRYRG